MAVLFRVITTGDCTGIKEEYQTMLLVGNLYRLKNNILFSWTAKSIKKTSLFLMSLVIIHGKLNVMNESLVDREKVILPLLRIKLELIKQFRKALEEHKQCFAL